MAYYNSKYSGKEVDERLGRVDDIPQKVSELDNDMGFLTKENADNAYDSKGASVAVAKDVESLSKQVDNLNEKITELENNEIAWTEVQ